MVGLVSCESEFNQYTHFKSIMQDLSTNFTIRAAESVHVWRGCFAHSCNECRVSDGTGIRVLLSSKMARTRLDAARLAAQGLLETATCQTVMGIVVPQASKSPQRVNVLIPFHSLLIIIIIFDASTLKSPRTLKHGEHSEMINWRQAGGTVYLSFDDLKFDLDCF